MDRATIIYENGFYEHNDGTTPEMDVLGVFLASDVGCDAQEWSLLKDWALANKADPHSRFNYTMSGNTTFLEEDADGTIHLIDDTSSDPDDIHYIPTRIKMTRQQFVLLLDDWAEKVCVRKPEEVIITYDNNQFIIETHEG